MINKEEKDSYPYKKALFIMITPQVICYATSIPLLTWAEKAFSPHPLVAMLLVDIIQTVQVFAWSLAFRNTSIYDPYWMVFTLEIAIQYMQKCSALTDAAKWIAVSPVLLYCIKHVLYQFRFWPGLKYEDFRYLRFKEWIKSPIIYWSFSFLGLHMLPSAMTYTGMLPIQQTLAIKEPAQSDLLKQIGIVVALVGLSVEAIADEQLLPWRSLKTDKYIDEGLWRQSRHPNYFGDTVFWWGLQITSLGYNCQYWWTIIGAIFITLVFQLYSIPVMEKHILKKRPQYANVIGTVSRFVPWFRNKSDASIHKKKEL